MLRQRKQKQTQIWRNVVNPQEAIAIGRKRQNRQITMDVSLSLRLGDFVEKTWVQLEVA